MYSLLNYMNSINHDWTQNDEKILIDWIDESSSYKWMHDRSFKIYWWFNLFFMLPIIVLSTVTGTANFSLERIPSPTRGYITMVIGTLNIFAGIISTLYQFLKIAELKENHNMMYKNFDKFNRNLKLELNKQPSERKSKKEFLELTRKEYDRLIENSPDIPTIVIKMFRRKFKKIKNLIIPDIADNIRTYNNINQEIKPISPLNLHKNKYYEEFKNKYDRSPTDDEVNEHIEMFYSNV